MDQIVLIIFMLNIESSYLQDIEKETLTPGDTVQFMLINGEAWRIKTFAIDHDVHVWSLGPMEVDKFNEIASTNTKKHYGDVLNKKILIQTEKSFDGLREELKGIGLPDFLEIPKSKEFAFWVPESNVYKNKSTPE